MPAQGSRNIAGKYRLYCNLGYNLSEDAVRDYFQRLCTKGRILDVYIPRHSSGRNKGYGFTTFQSEADLEVALQRTEHLIDGSIVKVNRAGPRPEYQGPQAQPSQEEPQSSRPPGSEGTPGQGGSASGAAVFGKGPRLYVGGIAESITEQQILQHFQQWGTVVDIYFPGKRGQKRVNYCFVTFSTWQAAERASTESECTIDGEAVKSISIAEERLVLPVQPQLQPALGSMAPLLDGRASGSGLDRLPTDPDSTAAGRAVSPADLIALQQQLAGQDLNSSQLWTWPQQWRQPIAGSQLENMVAAANYQGDNMLLSLQHQYQQQQQELLLQEQRQTHQQLLPSGNDPLGPAYMPGLHAGVPNLGLTAPGVSDMHALGLEHRLPGRAGLLRPAEAPLQRWDLADVGGGGGGGVPDGFAQVPQFALGSPELAVLPSLMGSRGVDQLDGLPGERPPFR